MPVHSLLEVNAAAMKMLPMVLKLSETVIFIKLSWGYIKNEIEIELTQIDDLMMTLNAEIKEIYSPQQKVSSQNERNLTLWNGEPLITGHFPEFE
jgi:hypothetical protein